MFVKVWICFYLYLNMFWFWNFFRELVLNLYLVFWVSNIVGVSIRGKFGLVEIGISGLELMMVVIFVMNVFRILWVNVFLLVLISMELSILWVIFIIFFYVLFMWEVWGGLKIYMVLELWRYFFKGLLLIYMVLMCKWFIVLIKLVFWLEWNVLIGFCIVVNFLMVLMKVDEFIFFIILMCIVLVIK